MDRTLQLLSHTSLGPASVPQTALSRAIKCLSSCPQGLFGMWPELATFVTRSVRGSYVAFAGYAVSRTKWHLMCTERILGQNAFQNNNKVHYSVRKESNTGPYSERDEYFLHHPTHFPYQSIYTQVFRVVSYLQTLQSKYYTRYAFIIPPPHARYMPCSSHPNWLVHSNNAHIE